MKKCALLTVIIFMALPVWGQTSISVGAGSNGMQIEQQNQDMVRLQANISVLDITPVWTKAGDFSLLSGPGLIRSHRIGEPSLPTMNRLIAIPIDCTVEVNVIAVDEEIIDLSAEGITHPLMPVQPSLSKSDDPLSQPFEYNRAVYDAPGFYSLPVAEAKPVGIMRGLRLARVVIAPVQYDAANNLLKVYRNITIEVRFNGSNQSATRDLWKQNYSPFFEPLYGKVMNYEGQYSVMRDDLTKYPVKYLIISDRMFEAQLAPYIEWKTKKGFNVQVAYTDIIGTSNSQIKSYIQSVYNAGTPQDPAPSFVLLVGDAQQIMPFPGVDGHITDLYFCEFTGDVLPEIYYGRFSAQTPSELQPQIDKTLEYEQYLMPDPSYLGEVTMVSGVDGSYAPTYGNGQINYGTNLYFNAAHGITPQVWLYPASDASGAAADIISSVSDGVSLYNYTAHCSHTGHADPPFTTSDLPGLSNYHQYLLGIGNCCLPNTFSTDYSTPCFGEAFLQLQDRGGIGYIGATDNTYWDEDYWWGVGYGPIVGAGPAYEDVGQGAYDGVFHDHGEPITQHYIANDAIVFAGNMAITESGSSRETYYWEAYMLMGDPSLMTYLGVPVENNVTHDAIFLITANEITVQADPASYVGISFNGALMGAGYVDASGSVTIPITSFGVPGVAEVVVTAQNKQPYAAEVQVITPSGPYVVYGSHTADDLSGNGNGLIENGETIQMGITLTNVGPDTAYNVNATLSTTNPHVTILDATEAYGTVAPDSGTAYVLDGFAFAVASDVSDKEPIKFDLTVTGTARDTWNGSFTIVAHSPNVVYKSTYIDDSSGDSNGIVDPGETADLAVGVINNGSAVAGNIQGTLTCSDAYITILDGDAVYGSIDSTGGIGSNDFDLFTVSASADCPIGYAVPMNLTLTGDGDYSKVLTFNLTVGDRVVFYWDDFSFDQGWTGMGGSAEWTIGSPAGGGGDPSEDHTPTSDNMVLGNDLTSAGTYNANISPMQYVYSPVIDCGSLSGVIMSFWHWLGIETSNYDHAYFEAYDGSSWVRFYENPAQTVQPIDWTQENYDLSAVADSNPNFQLRFGISSDGSVQGCGWNIDDIELKGYGRVGTPAVEFSDASMSAILQPESQETQNLRIRNLGDGTLRIVFSTSSTWLQCSGVQQTIAAGDSLVFPVTFDAAGVGCGDHSCALSYISNDNGNQGGSIPASMTILEPDVAISSLEVNGTLASGNQATQPLTISNNGIGNLYYQVGCQMYDKTGPVKSTAPEFLGERPADGDKSDVTEPFYGPVSRSFGGPDTFGHSWVDSDEPGGPAYSWVDISASGTSIVLGDDAFVGPINIGFGFPLYDSVYSQLYVGSNGILTFDAGSSSRVNAALPTLTMKSMVCGYWDDLNPNAGGSIYYLSDPANGRFIVSFVAVPIYYSGSGTGALSFQMILSSSGAILLQYGTMTPGSATLAGETSGIQNSGATDGLQVSYNSAYVHSDMAVAIDAKRWLSVTPSSGMIEPGLEETLQITFDAADLEDGIYTGMIAVSSNDPDSPSLQLPVTLTVASFICGDVDGNGVGPDITDLTYMVDYLFSGGDAPPVEAAADLDGSGAVPDIVDLTYFVDYLFASGADPVCR